MLQLTDLRISDNTQLALAAVACLAVVVVVRARLAKSGSGLPLPPSPPTRKLQGHILPSISPFLTVARWIDEYGPLITIRLGNQNVVIIGRCRAAMDIMEKQGGSVADRPRMVAIGEILSGGQSIVHAHAGDRLRRMRKALHTHLQPKSAEEYQPLQMLHANNILLNILDDSSNFHNHIITYAATTIMKIAYGKNMPTSATDPDVIEIRRLLRFASTVMRSDPYLVEWIPWLKYLPWYGQELKYVYEREKRLNIGHLNRVRQEMQSDVDVGPSFARHMLENGRHYGLTENEMAFLVGTFFRAGLDTVSTAMFIVLMAAACFPEEQAKVQAELDEVIGVSRVPTFADQQSLPRLQAFIFEALRWRPSVPTGLAHRTTADVIWENYCIPAGTTVIGHHWAISRDPEVFPEPHEFKPERWINEQGDLIEDPKFFVYGFGRRVCPGQHVANKSVFITSLLILWAFQLALDPTKPFDDMGFINGNPQCSIKVEARVPEAELRQMVESASKVL